jgi:hypothetical protein
LSFQNRRAAMQSSEAPSDETLWQAAIGPKADYYLPRFAKFQRDKRSFPSWNWPALFATFWWALYRKLWGGAVLFFVLTVLVQIALLVLSGLLAPRHVAASRAISFFSLPLSTWPCALLANGLYYRRVKSWVRLASAHDQDRKAQLAYLSEKGGTAPTVTVVAIIIGVVAFAFAFLRAAG